MEMDMDMDMDMGWVCRMALLNRFWRPVFSPCHRGIARDRAARPARAAALKQRCRPPSQPPSAKREPR